MHLLYNFVFTVFINAFTIQQELLMNFCMKMLIIHCCTTQRYVFIFFSQTNLLLLLLVRFFSLFLNRIRSFLLISKFSNNTYYSKNAPINTIKKYNVLICFLSCTMNHRSTVHIRC